MWKLIESYTSCRSGIYSKVVTCSRVTIRSIRHTAAEHTLLRSSHCSVQLHKLCCALVFRVLNSSRILVSLMQDLQPPPLLLTRYLGDFRADVPLPVTTSLEMREDSLEGDSRAKFLAMTRKMLQWEASKRASAKALAEDEWIKDNM